MSVWVQKVLLVSENQKPLSSLVDVLESTAEEEGSGKDLFFIFYSLHLIGSILLGGVVSKGSKGSTAHR
jgi:hypothetical protein